MSWFFGYYCKKDSTSGTREINLPDDVTFKQETENYFFSAGENKNIFFDAAGNELFVVCGIGIDRNFKTVSDTNHWKLIALPNILNHDFIDGHYAGVSITADSFTFFTDPLGLREIFFFETKDKIFFSTRLDLILNLERFEIDFKEFGSRWMLLNQISTESIVKNIKRVNCGSIASIRNKELSIKTFTWLPQENKKSISIIEFSDLVRKYFLLAEENRKISLSLSGGLDSRMLLSLLLKQKNIDWSAHSFSNSNSADEEVARKLASHFHFPLNIIKPQELSRVELFDYIKNYIANTYLAESAFNAVNLLGYDNLPDNEIIIDGGFGEIWRREFFLKLLLKSRKAVADFDPLILTKNMLLFRSEIFNKDTIDLMFDSSMNQVSELMKKITAESKILPENIVDFFVIKSRLPNYYGAEQNRIDGKVSALMPFAQFSLLNKLFSVPVETRRNNKLFKSIITLNVPALKQFSLSKGNITYPYFLNSFGKRIYTKIFSGLKKNEDSSIRKFLSVLKDFSFDSVNSSSFKNYPYYDHAKIKKLVDEIYEKNNMIRFNEFSWFLAFEIFRQTIEE